MANTTTKRPARTKTAQPETAVQNTISEEVVATPEITKATKAAASGQKIVARDIDPNQYVIVRNGYQGTLIYKSSRTGETFIWDSFGSEQEMELRELRAAKNSAKGFFTNNWFMFDEDWIVDYLGVGKFYKNALSIDEFDNVFTMSADELATVISNLSEGQKKSVAYRAKELIATQEIDSLSVISTLEDALGISLIER